MTRALLAQFIDQVGIVDASILLHRYPITLERWSNGRDEIPQRVADWLAGWAKADESEVLIVEQGTNVERPSADASRTPASITIPAGSLGVNDSLPPTPTWRLRYPPEEQARIEAMANSKGVELDEQTAAELWQLVEGRR
jgi:hypothetical protein